MCDNNFTKYNFFKITFIGAVVNVLDLKTCHKRTQLYNIKTLYKYFVLQFTKI